MKLSHSQVNKYLTCPRSYKHHYVSKLREKSFTAFLPFGSAIDHALNFVLEDIKQHKTIKRDYNAEFIKMWLNPIINKQPAYLPDNTLVGYAKADMCLEILKDEDLAKIRLKIDELTPDYKDIELPLIVDDLQIKLSQKSYKKFDINEHKLLNNIFWLCMKNKGLLMLDAYVKNIVPQITEVLHIQKKVDLVDDKDNSIIGFIDAVVRLKGHSEVIVLDNKTSSSPYDESDVNKSPQLGLYCFSENTTKAAYAVMLKNIKLNKIKTCVKCGFKTNTQHSTCNNTVDNTRCKGNWKEEYSPEATTQLFVDTIKPEVQQTIVDNYTDIERAVTHNVFPQNFNACENYYGNKCAYYKLCWENSKEGLIQE